MRGGKREGAGRPLSAGQRRKQRQLRATDEEWQLIKRFEKLIKYSDKQACIDALIALDSVNNSTILGGC